METIYIKRQTGRSGQTQYVVPAMGIRTREGVRLIPHPYGTETTSYDDLEQAVSHIHRAGFAAEFDGKHYPPSGRAIVSAPRPMPTRSQGTPISVTIQNALPLLHQQLKDAQPGVVASAAFALGEIKDETALPGLIHAFSNDDPTVRKHAAEALAKIGKPAANAIQMALKDKSWVVRHTALTAIYELIHIELEQIPALLPDVVPLLKDDTWLVRSQAATVIGEATRVFNNLLEKE